MSHSVTAPAFHFLGYRAAVGHVIPTAAPVTFPFHYGAPLLWAFLFPLFGEYTLLMEAVPPAVALACRCASISVVNAGRVGSSSSDNFSFNLVSRIPATSIIQRTSCRVIPPTWALLAAAFRLSKNALSSWPGCCDIVKNCFLLKMGGYLRLKMAARHVTHVTPPPITGVVCWMVKSSCNARA